MSLCFVEKVYKMDEEVEELCRIFQLLNRKLNRKKDLPQIEENFITINDAEIFRDVKNFNDFVRKHGNSGGWDDIDHSVFVNLRRKHNLQSIIYHLRLHFPEEKFMFKDTQFLMAGEEIEDISEEEIIEHDKWYTQYLKLKTLQQKAFKFWNIKKKEDKSRPQSASTVTSNTSRSTEHQRRQDDLKIKIQKWKEYKEQLKQNEQKINAIKVKQNAEKEKIKKIIQENKKRAVKEYREEKIQIQNAIWMTKLSEENNKSEREKRIANKMLPLFRRKDEKIIRKLQDRRDSSQQKREEHQLLLEKLVSKYRKTIKVERDPKRLLNPTVEWRQKIFNHEDEKENISIFANPRDITNIPHLAVPNWRKNLLLKE